MNLIEERVTMARAGENPFVISRLPSSWLVIGDVQPLPGYCLLLADPVVPSLNALDTRQRMEFLNDMAMVGDALLAVTGCDRVNYEIWGNTEPALHAPLCHAMRQKPMANVSGRPAWDTPGAILPNHPAMNIKTSRTSCGPI